MDWFKEADFQEIPAHSRSFSVTVANLVKYLGDRDDTPTEVYSMLSAVNQYPDLLNFDNLDESLFKKDLHDNEGTFPHLPGTIIKYIRTDLETGERKGHYCLFIDYENGIVVDSLDGIEKSMLSYGHIYSWATFTQREEVGPVFAAPIKYVAGSFHLWKKGDSLVDIAREMHVPVEKLKDFNEIESYAELEDGIPIYYPAPAVSTARRISVEVLPEKLHMHVAKPNGAKKWAFGSMRIWDDARPSGFFPEGTNVIIVAIAKVPIDDPDDPTAEAAYYLDHNALGEYTTSGILRFTLGFAWSDLEHGHIETLTRKADPAPDPVIPPYLEDLDEPEVEETDVEPVSLVEVPETLPNGLTREYIESVLSDYQKLDTPEDCITQIPEGHEGAEFDQQTGHFYVWIHDFTRKKPDRPLYHNQDVTIGATFTDPDTGEKLGRPVDSIESNNFFGIPLSVLRSEGDFFMYNERVSAESRQQAGGSLTWSEQYLWIPSMRFLRRFVPGFLKKINNNKKE
jgi:hypothetical protein